MLLRRISVENVRSFLDRTDLVLDGHISILIGPNGGGKTNLLDSVVIMLRRHLFASMYAVHVPTPEQPQRYEFRQNDMLNNLLLEKHSAAPHSPQVVEIEIEITSRDLAGMQTIKDGAAEIIQLAANKYVNLRHQNAAAWDTTGVLPGQRVVYILRDGALQYGDPASSFSQHFLQYLQLFEADSQLRDEYGLSQISWPMVYLPVNRSANIIQSSIELAGYNAYETKRQSDASTSRTQFTLAQIAIARLAQRYRTLLERDNGAAATDFRSDKGLVELTSALSKLGYSWSLVCTDPLRNAYDVQLTKQGSTFLISRASSGERELLTYLFTIFALNVRDALIVVDEPELHLHPKWQNILLQLFVDLAVSTGNQFLLATHSPMFVSPSSVNYVSRVYTDQQRSRIARLEVNSLPDGRHLINTVNSQNNERIFFSDKVLLVEGLSDLIFFEAALQATGGVQDGTILEVVSVGGKGLFPAYEQLLKATGTKYAIIADLDYTEQVASSEVKTLFVQASDKIKRDVLDNPGSKDAAALVAAVDHALQTGSWDEAGDVWCYIKARHQRLQPSLTDEQREVLHKFITSKESEGVFILQRGALEAYLPEGYRRKDIDKLIRLTKDPAFWSKLPAEPRTEVESILRAIRSL